jgi:hypothetical protein
VYGSNLSQLFQDLWLIFFRAIMNKELKIGTAGFIGFSLCKRLLNLGLEFAKLNYQ